MKAHAIVGGVARIDWDQDTLLAAAVSFVVYANGYNPEEAEVYEECREAVGGDDFAETIILDGGWVEDVLAGSDLCVQMNRKNYSIHTEPPENTERQKNRLREMLSGHVLFTQSPRHKGIRTYKLENAANDVLAVVADRKKVHGPARSVQLGLAIDDAEARNITGQDKLDRISHAALAGAVRAAYAEALLRQVKREAADAPEFLDFQRLYPYQPPFQW